jgi:hypothetical protein
VDSRYGAIAIGRSATGHVIAAFRDDGMLMAWDRDTLERLVTHDTGISEEICGLAVWPAGARAVGALVLSREKLVAFDPVSSSVVTVRGEENVGLFTPQPMAGAAEHTGFVVWGEFLGVSVGQARDGRLDLAGAVGRRVAGSGTPVFIALAAPCLWADRPVVVTWLRTEARIVVMDARNGGFPGTPALLASAGRGQDLLVAAASSTGRIQI